MKRRRLFKVIAFLLALVMLFGMMPVTALETEIMTGETNIPEAETAVPSVGKEPNPDYVEESQTREVTERREANVKHFRLEDGSYEAVAYGYPVHRKDADGEWQDIDNRLLRKEVGGKTVYATTDSRVTFANQTGSGDLMTLSENGYTIRMGYLPPSNTVITASQPAVIANHASREAQLQAISPELSEAEKLEQLHRIDNTTSVVYESVQQGINLKYVLQANDIKEYIVVEAPQSAYVYRFGLLLDGLEAELTEQGDIILRDAETDEEPYTIPAPFMVDANNAVSTAVCYELEQIGDGAYILTVEADAAWFGQAERAYPVMIDPTIRPTYTIQDTFVNAGDPNGIYKDWAVWVGPSFIGLFKVTRPTLPSGTTVMGGTLNVAYYYQNGESGRRTIGAYQMTGYWSKSSVTYNTLYNQYGSSLGISSTLLDFGVATASPSATSSSPKWISFDIDEAVESWYSGTANNGIALKHISGNPVNTSGATIGTVIVDSELNSPYTAYFTVKYLYEPLASGVYKVKSAYNGLYLDVSDNGYSEGTPIIQWQGLGDSKLNQLFKFTYLGIYGDYHYYSIRPMVNSGLLLETPLSGTNRNATIEAYSTNDSWSSLLYNHLWAVDKEGSYYTLKNGHTTEASYLQTPANSTTGESVFTASSKGSTANWILEPYTGDLLQTANFTTYTSNMIVGEEFTFHARMYSSSIGVNGPVQYLVRNADGTATDKATINSSTGKIQALKPGEIRVGATFSGTTTYWYRTVTIEESLEGVCFFMNGYYDNKYMQIKQESSVSLEGAILELDEFNGESRQQWKIEYISSGYYKIVSVASGKAITAPSSENEALTQNIYTGATTQQWKITDVGAGMYKVSPRAYSSYYMAAGDVLLEELLPINGRDVELRANRSDYKDEWYIVLPTSGYEIEYAPNLWNYDPVVDGTNCYAYSLNNQVEPGTNDLCYMQPGQFAGYILTQNNLTASTVVNYVMADSSALGFTFEEVDRNTKCSKGSYKVALVIDPGVDYHWYRQNPDGTWSHKPGRGNVVNTDASGMIIYDPQEADRDYSFPNYTVFVGYFEVTPLNNFYVSGATLTTFDTITIEPNKDRLPTISTISAIQEGALFSDVTNTIGLPQRVRTFGLMVVEYDMTDGNTLVVEYVRNSDGYFEIASMKIEK